MKSALATLAIILSGLAASAQTTTDTVSMVPTTIVINMPCGRNGAGDIVTFKGTIRTVLHVHTDANGIQDGFQIGLGAFTGTDAKGFLYQAEGGSEVRFTGLNRATTDQSDVFTDSFHIRGGSNLVNGKYYRKTGTIVISDAGQTITISQPEVVCQ